MRIRGFRHPSTWAPFFANPKSGPITRQGRACLPRVLPPCRAGCHYPPPPMKFAQKRKQGLRRSPGQSSRDGSPLGGYLVAPVNQDHKQLSGRLNTSQIKKGQGFSKWRAKYPFFYAYGLSTWTWGWFAPQPTKKGKTRSVRKCRKRVKKIPPNMVHIWGWWGTGVPRYLMISSGLPPYFSSNN